MTSTSKSNSWHQKPRIKAGRVLTAARDRRGISLHQAARETKIDIGTLKKFEGGEFSKDNPYQRGLVESYSRFLGVGAGDFKSQEVKKNREWQAKKQKTVITRKSQSKKALVASTSVKTSLAIGFVLVAIGGVVLLTAIFFAPPKLAINNIDDIKYTNDSSIILSGSTSGGSDVFINSTPILVEPDGNFEQRVFLKSGVNTISIEAVNNLSRTALIEKTIVAEYEPFN